MPPRKKRRAPRRGLRSGRVVQLLVHLRLNQIQNRILEHLIHRVRTSSRFRFAARITACHRENDIFLICLRVELAYSYAVRLGEWASRRIFIQQLVVIYSKRLSGGPKQVRWRVG